MGIIRVTAGTILGICGEEFQECVIRCDGIRFYCSCNIWDRDTGIYVGRDAIRGFGGGYVSDNRDNHDRVRIMKVREHRGGFEESMGRVVEISGSMESLVQEIRSKIGKWVEVNLETVKVEKYVYDSRNGWDTYIISVLGYGVYGFSDGGVV